jgi:serine/threonine-protein kinase RsbW
MRTDGETQLVALRNHTAAERCAGWWSGPLGRPSAMEIELCLSLPRDEISIPVVRRICRQALTVLGVRSEHVDDVELALAEACSNVMLHARLDDHYEVSVGVGDHVAVIEVLDRGGGFPRPASLAAPAPVGLGALTDGSTAEAGLVRWCDAPTSADASSPDPFPEPGPADGELDDPMTPDPSPADGEELAEEGRGIVLMRALMDLVRFNPVGGPHPGTLVHLEKKLGWEPSAPGLLLRRGHTEHDPRRHGSNGDIAERLGRGRSDGPDPHTAVVVDMTDADQASLGPAQEPSDRNQGHADQAHTGLAPVQPTGSASVGSAAPRPRQPEIAAAELGDRTSPPGSSPGPGDEGDPAGSGEPRRHDCRPGEP